MENISVITINISSPSFSLKNFVGTCLKHEHKMLEVKNENNIPCKH